MKRAWLIRTGRLGERKVSDVGIAQEVLLAEFSALRDEIIQLHQMQSNVFAIQLTAAAAIFSFSLSSHSHAGFLLILPVLSYALTRRYLEISSGMDRISKYITEELSPKVHGGFAWEEWNRKLLRSTIPQLQPRLYRKIASWMGPTSLIFPWISIAALVWVIPYILFQHGVSEFSRSILSIIWLLDLILSLISLMMIRRPPILLSLLKRASQLRL